MAKKSAKSKDKPKKRIKCLIKRLARDLEELISLSIEKGDISKEDVAKVLHDVGIFMISTEKKYGPSKSLRKVGRFMEYLHKPHQKVLEEGQLLKEEKDQRTLRYIQVLIERGKTPAEVARIMRKEGNKITAAGIRRILSNEA